MHVAVTIINFVKEVPYAKMRHINLTSARKLKADLHDKIENLQVVEER